MWWLHGQLYQPLEATMLPMHSCPDVVGVWPAARPAIKTTTRLWWLRGRLCPPFKAPSRFAPNTMCILPNAMHLLSAEPASLLQPAISYTRNGTKHTGLGRAPRPQRHSASTQTGQPNEWASGRGWAHTRCQPGISVQLATAASDSPLRQASMSTRLKPDRWQALPADL